MQYKFAFCWFVDGVRKRVSEVEGTLADMRGYCDLAWAWFLRHPERKCCRVYAPGNFKTQCLSKLLAGDWFVRQAALEAKVRNYVGD